MVTMLLVLTACSTTAPRFNHDVNNWSPEERRQHTEARLSYEKGNKVTSLGESIVAGEFKVYQKSIAVLNGMASVGTKGQFRIDVDDAVAQTVALIVSDGSHTWIADLMKGTCDRLDNKTQSIALGIESTIVQVPVGLLYTALSGLGHPSTVFVFKSAGLPVGALWMETGNEIQIQYQDWNYFTDARTHDYFPGKWRLTAYVKSEGKALEPSEVQWEWKNLKVDTLTAHTQERITKLFQKPPLASCRAP